MSLELQDSNEANKNTLTVNNNFGFKKPKEQKFHYYNHEYEEYTDVIMKKKLTFFFKLTLLNTV